MTPRSLYCYNHHGNGTEYIRALQAEGFRMSGPNSASVILMDYDIPGRIKPSEARFKMEASKLFIYPHAAGPNVGWDGLLPKSPYICGIFVSADGHADILKKIGIQYPIYTAGWTYCEIKEFKPIENPRRLLFAPIHPTKRGFLSKVDAGLNLGTFQKLLSVRDHFQITVRHIQSLESNGLPRVDGIQYVQGETSLKSSCAQVADNDVIVGHQTIAHIAVAMGKPTIMIGEDVPPRNGSCESDFKFVEHFDDYRDLLMFPLDILAEDDTIGLILRSAKSDEEIRDWRERMIGNPFNPRVVSDTIICYL